MSWNMSQKIGLFLRRECSLHRLYKSITHIIHDVGPPLERHALKHRQHGQSKVVEVGDAEVWTDPVEVTELVE